MRGTQERGSAVAKDEFPSSCDERLEASLEDMNDDSAHAASSNATEERTHAILAEKCLFPDPSLQKCINVYEVFLLPAAGGPLKSLTSSLRVPV